VRGSQTLRLSSTNWGVTRRGHTQALQQWGGQPAPVRVSVLRPHAPRGVSHQRRPPRPPPARPTLLPPTPASAVLSAAVAVPASTGSDPLRAAAAAALAASPGAGPATGRASVGAGTTLAPASAAAAGAAGVARGHRREASESVAPRSSTGRTLPLPPSGLLSALSSANNSMTQFNEGVPLALRWPRASRGYG
jgi:hypothetical protein